MNDLTKLLDDELTELKGVLLKWVERRARDAASQEAVKDIDDLMKIVKDIDAEINRRGVPMI